MDTQFLPNSTSPPPDTTEGEANGRVGPAGRRAETPWNSRERQLSFGSLDAEERAAPAPGSNPPPPGKKPVNTEPRPTWPIALVIIAVLGGGIAYIARHPAGAPPASNTTSDSGKSAKDSGKSTSPQTAKATPAPHKTKHEQAVTKDNPVPPHRAATPAPRKLTIAPRPEHVEKPVEVRPRPVRSTSPVIAAAPPKPTPALVVAPKPSVEAPHHNTEPSEDTAAQRAKDLLGGGG